MPERVHQARVVVVRHGPAEVRDPARWPDDRLRPLSEDGARQTRRVAAALGELLGKASFVASGPALRTRRTAELIGRALDPPRRVALWPELDLGGPADAILGRLARSLHGSAQGVVVGHDPVLAELIGLALTGDGVALARLTKGGAACVEFPVAIRPGSGRLLWLLTRKQLAARAARS